MPNFTVILDYIKVLLLEDEEDFKIIAAKLSGSYQ
jgi:hypothetical protein